MIHTPNRADIVYVLFIMTRESDGTTPGWRKLEFSETELAFSMDGTRHSYPRVSLPADFMEWTIAGRLKLYEELETGGHASFFGAHLPVVVTYNRQDSFPFNTGNKGVGLLPQPEKMDEYCTLYEQTFERCDKLPREESLAGRLQAVRRFLESGAVSDQRLATLEIFEKTTFANLCDYPIATLHYAGEGPVYRSFQIDTVVEILTPDDAEYHFPFLSRRLFEIDEFHLTQTRFPYAYLFHPVRVRDKTPFSRCPR
jgi:hypothetical protein